MARLRCGAAEDSGTAPIPTRTQDRGTQRTTRPKPAPKYAESDDSNAEESDKKLEVKPEATAENSLKSKSQVRLAPLKSLSSFSDLTIQDDTPEKARRRLPLEQPRTLIQKKLSPTKTAIRVPSPPPEISTADVQQNPVPVMEEDLENGPEEHIDVEESIWCGSESDFDSDDSLPSPSTFFPPKRKEQQQQLPNPDLAKQLGALKILDDEVHDPKPNKPLAAPRKPSVATRPSSSSGKENNNAIIHFSPPRFKKPVERMKSIERPRTPPAAPESPSKDRLQSPSKLLSPSKRAPRIPTPPLRPSLDAFWTAEAVNDWHDQHSPQKPLRSPQKLFASRPPIDAGQDDSTPTASPRKYLQSPTKRTKSEIQARRDWDIRKLSLAESFLIELDQTITQGRIAELSASTGGVKIIWSKTLNSTAGRANWRRETTKSTTKSDPNKTTVVHKHFASIELAEKVLTYSPDCETKLLNVLAHEFCHLANFMVSGIKDQPHGASFKDWGRKCSKEFAGRGIQVTTKHSYEIEYKYLWQCEQEECGTEFKRHSKSIDPKRHRCGQCRGNLLQIRPVPRGGGMGAAKKGSGAGSSGGVSTPVGGIAGNGYAGFVKVHFAALKKAMPGASHKEIMEALGKKYRAEKAAKLAGTSLDVDRVAEKLGEVRLDVREVIKLD